VFFDKTTAQLPITKALLGESTHNGLREILFIRNEIAYALEDRLQLDKKIQYVKMSDPEIHKEANELRRIIYGTFSEKDALYQKHLKALNNLEEKLLPLIRGE